jgi:hypothetical protein
MILGQKAKDKITGFEGILTGKCEYLTGCTQYSIQPITKDDGGFIEGRWFDEGRLEITGDGIKKSDVLASDNGADFSAPIK